MILCKDCKYFERLTNSCYSPENGVSLLDGKPQYRNANTNRGSKTLMYKGFVCGPDGAYFVEKTSILKKIRAWYLWNRTYNS